MSELKDKMPLKLQLDLLLVEHTTVKSEFDYACYFAQTIRPTDANAKQAILDSLEYSGKLWDKLAALNKQILETIELIKSEYADKTE